MNHQWRKKCSVCFEDNPALPKRTFFQYTPMDPEEYFKMQVKRAEEDAQEYLKGYPGQVVSVCLF